ncbi:MAG: hypothetical protein AB1652_06275 [Bacillota bacterium]
MLDKVIATFGALFVILLFMLGGALFIGWIGQWYALQNEADFLAKSQGKYGGYTTEANAELNRFIAERNLDRSRLTVQVSAPGGPVYWGTPVRATITHNFPFRLGNFVAFDVPVTGAGRSVSAYAPGAYNVTYTWPTY